MIINLRDSKARLSELVELASSGEDVLITVRGKPKARLTRVTVDTEQNLARWAAELEERQNRYTRACGNSVESILDSTREERTF